jgi:hypothetical protein
MVYNLKQLLPPIETQFKTKELFYWQRKHIQMLHMENVLMLSQEQRNNCVMF